MSRIRLPSSKTRGRLLWAAVALVVVLAAALVAAHWSTARYVERTLEAFRTEVGPLDPEFYREPRVAGPENAAVSYLAAAEALGLATEKSELLRSLASGDSDWEGEDVDSVQAALDLLGPVREHLSRANNLPSSSYGANYSEVMTAAMRDMLSLLRLQRVLLVEARLASRHGDTESLLASASSSAGLAASLRQEGLLICTLLAIAAEKTTLQIVAETLARGASREIVEGFSRDLEKLDRATLPLDAVFATEGAFVYQAMSETPAETGDWKPSRFQRVLQGWRIDRVNIGAFDFYRELVATSDRPFTDLSARLDAEGALRAHTVTGKIQSILAPN